MLYCIPQKFDNINFDELNKWLAISQSFAHTYTVQELCYCAVVYMYEQNPQNREGFAHHTFQHG